MEEEGCCRVMRVREPRLLPENEKKAGGVLEIRLLLKGIRQPPGLDGEPDGVGLPACAWCRGEEEGMAMVCWTWPRPSGGKENPWRPRRKKEEKL